LGNVPILWVIEKTVRKAERARFPSRMERRAKPVSERDFLVGEIPHVFETPSLIVHSLSRKMRCLAQLFSFDKA
jgi:hypothetical protein